jgi:hypothetical protein
MNLEGFQCCEHVVNAINAIIYLVFYDLFKCVCLQFYLEFIECVLHALLVYAICKTP